MIAGMPRGHHVWCATEDKRGACDCWPPPRPSLAKLSLEAAESHLKDLRRGRRVDDYVEGMARKWVKDAREALAESETYWGGCNCGEHLGYGDCPVHGEY